jgi:hypothetical protein
MIRRLSARLENPSRQVRRLGNLTEDQRERRPIDLARA